MAGRSGIGLEDVVGILGFDCWPILLIVSSDSIMPIIFNMFSDVVQLCEDGALKSFMNVFQ